MKVYTQEFLYCTACENNFVIGFLTGILSKKESNNCPFCGRETTEPMKVKDYKEFQEEM